MKRIICIAAFLFSISTIYSQFLMRKQTVVPQLADSLDISYYSKKRPWHAVSSIIGMNLGLWAFDRYVLDGEYAYISMNSISANIKGGFKWDNDRMTTNLFMHPYTGGLYYNMARSNGYNYWQSGAFTLGGSLMWELLLENQAPSVNDLISTSMGGLVFGEVSYRASDMILDDRKRGGDRILRECASFLISPTTGLTRIITGDAWKVRPTSGSMYGIPDISVDVSLGGQFLGFNDRVFDKDFGAVINAEVEYGDKFENDAVAPYDYFTLRMSLNLLSSQPPLGQFNVIGRLLAAELVDSKTNYLGIGLFQHFDFYDSDTISQKSAKVPYKFSAPVSVGAGLVHQNKSLTHIKLDSYAHLNAIVLGASLSDHYFVDQRNYNLGSGFGLKLGINAAYEDKIGISCLYEGYKLFTWQGYPEGDHLEQGDIDFNAQGDKSNATFNVLSAKLQAKIVNQVYFTTIFTGYFRKTNYAYFDDVFSASAEGRVMLTYKF